MFQFDSIDIQSNVGFIWLSNFPDVTNITNPLMYWVIWPTGKGNFVESQRAKRLWPHLVIDYLQNNLKTEYEEL